MSTLVIVESPAKAKTIKKYLGSDYEVKASVGHVRDLPKSNKDAVDIENGYVPTYVVPAAKEKVINELKSAAKAADAVILATDPDREGEAIAWHLYEVLNLNKKDTSRVTYSEITKDAVQEAFAKPRQIDEDLRQAQEARRVLDRLLGYDMSGLIWKKVRYGLSAGRVQSPALRILMEREREIRAFIPETFWRLMAHVITAKKEKLLLECSEEPREKSRVDEIEKLAQAGEWQVKDVSETPAKRNPAAPFRTSTLQQAASTRLGFSPSRTMRAAQKLYEQGHITYMRTDGTTLASSAIAQAATLIKDEYGEEYHELRQYKTSSKGAQEAHEAVRPTNLGKQAAGADSDQKRLYDLIWKRTVASQMKPAEILRTKISAGTSADKMPLFNVNGSQLTFDGWLRAFPEARGDDVLLPAVQTGDQLTLKDLDIEEKQTEPPHRYSEAGLVKELEKRGIGRPSTYASILKTLVDREYVTKEGRTLIPTDTGDVVSSFLEKTMPEYVSDDYTSAMEDGLDKIAEGSMAYAKMIDTYYKPFTKDLSEADEKTPKQTTLGPAPHGEKCPKCKADMVEKLGRGGIFLSCERFPDCDGARTRDGKEVKPEEPIGTDPESGLPIYVMDGRYGPYVQLGVEVKAKEAKEKGIPKFKPRRASLPAGTAIDEVTIELALKLLSLPRVLGEHPETGEEIQANIGRFGPYVVHDGDFRSIKEKDGDDPYTITFERALEIIKEPKKPARGRFAKKSTKKTKE